MSVFQEVKLGLAELLGLSKDALHIYAGLAISLLSAALFRWPLRSWKPIGAVLLAALAGEVWDVIDAWSAGGTGDGWKNWHDLWNTCLWPAVLFLVARYTQILKR